MSTTTPNADESLSTTTITTTNNGMKRIKSNTNTSSLSSSPNVVRYSQQQQHAPLNEMTIVEMDDAEPTTAPFPNVTTNNNNQQQQDDTTPGDRSSVERTSVDFDQFMETHSRLFRSRRTMAIINSIPKKHDERSWRQKLYLIMEHPRSSYLAMIVTIISSLMTVIQTVCLVLRSFPFFFQFEYLWIGITGSLSLYFMTEYLLRMLAYVNSWGDFRHFITGGMNIIDFLSFFSFWVDFIMYYTDVNDHFYAQTLTVFRILRLLKLIKLTRLSAKFQLLVVSIRRSFELLISLCILTFMGALISSTLIYYAERGLFDAKSGTWLRPDGTPSPFSNIMVCMWFSIVSLATVGYGDITPVTVPGRIIAIMTILSGIMIMALPSMAVGGIYGKLLTEFDTATDPANRVKQEERKEAEDDGIDLDLDEQSEKEEVEESKQKSWLSVDDILFGNQPQSNSFGDLGDWSKLSTKEVSSVDEGILGKMVVQQELLMQACVQQMEDMKQVIQELEKNL